MNNPALSTAAEYSDVEHLVIALLTLNEQGVGHVNISRVIQMASLTNLDGSKITALQVKKAIDNLVSLNILAIDYSYYEYRYLTEPIDTWESVLYVIERGNLDALVSALSPERFAQEPNTYDYYIGRIRIALVCGMPMSEVYILQQKANHALVLRGFKPDQSEFMVAAGQIYNPAIVKRFNFVIQYHYFKNRLSALFDYLGDTGELLNGCKNYLGLLSIGEAYVELRNILTEALLYFGDFKSAEDLLSEYGDKSNLIYQGAAHIMIGNHQVALQSFNRWRSAGDILSIIPGLPGYLYPISAIASGDPIEVTKAAEYINFASKMLIGTEEEQVYAAIKDLFDSHSGKPPMHDVLPDSDKRSLIATLFRNLVAHWTGVTRSDEEHAWLRECYLMCGSLELGWLTAQFGALLAATEGKDWREIADAEIASVGAVDALTWIKATPLWKRQIGALLKFGRGRSDVPDRRLVWVVNFGVNGAVEVEPREQKFGARKTWTKGKSVPLQRLVHERDQFGYLTRQDVQVLGELRNVAQFGSPLFVLDPLKACLALTGHPLVFLEDGDGPRVELVNQVAVLQVRNQGENYEVSIDPIIGLKSPVAILHRDTHTRYRVVPVSKEQREIGAVIGKRMVIPKDRKDDVLELTKSLASHFTIQTDIADVAAGVIQRDADARLHVHLLPHHEGLRMLLLVRPIPDAGPFFAPGVGGEGVTAEVDGLPVQARRSLQQERTLASELIARCEPLPHIEQVHGEWTIEDPQDCLEILVQLQNEPPDSIVIAWPEGVKFKLSNVVGHQQFKLTIRGERDWFAANGALEVDEGKVLDLTALLRALKAGRGRFINLGDNEFIALTEEFHRRLQDLDTFGELGKGGVRINPLSTFALRDLAQEVDEAQALEADEQWHRHVARLSSIGEYRPDVPSTLQVELRDYQRAGFEWLSQLAHWGVGACLADDMGLGKTVQSIALLLLRAEGGPALIIAPTSVCMNWVTELFRFAPTLQVRQFGVGDRERALQSLGPFDVVVTTYGLMQQQISVFGGREWHTVILDEAQAIKNSATNRSKAALQLRGEFKMALTGTPLENNLGELWSLFRFVNPGLLGSRESFNERFSGPIERSSDAEEATAARVALKRLVQPFILRRTKAKVLTELPSRTEITLPVELTAEERSLYESLRRSAVEAIAAASGPPGQAAIKALAELMKLRRACCNPNLVAPEIGLASSKLKLFGELMKELLENKHKVLVFSQFVDHLSLIRQLLEERGVQFQYLDGSTPMAERKKRVDAFQSGVGDAFLISLKAGGVGINLTAADYVIHMDPWWNPAVEDQASDRAHRMGQQRPVTIYRLVALHTIEEAIVELHKNKRDLADSLLDGTNMSASMSAAEILAILDRRWDA